MKNVLLKVLIALSAIGPAIFLATCDGDGDDDNIDDEAEGLPEAPSELKAIAVGNYYVNFKLDRQFGK